MVEIRQDDKIGLGHETSDIAADKVVRVVGGLVALLVVAALGGWAVLKLLLAATPVLPSTVPPRVVASAEPRLQLSPPRDLAALRAQEDQTLHSSGWIDREAGIARIPIEQAMALLVKRSKPTGETKP